MKKLISVLCITTLLTAGCSTTQPGSSEPRKVEPNRICYFLGTGFAAMRPALKVSRVSPVVPVDVQFRLTQADSTALTAFDTCVAAATASNTNDVNAQAIRILKVTNDVASLVHLYKEAAPDANSTDPTDQEIIAFVGELLIAGLVGSQNVTVMRQRLQDETPITTDELAAVRELLVDPAPVQP